MLSLAQVPVVAPQWPSQAFSSPHTFILSCTLSQAPVWEIGAVTKLCHAPRALGRDKPLHWHSSYPHPLMPGITAVLLEPIIC